MTENEEDKDLERAVEVATGARNNGSPNGRKAAGMVLDILTPILLRSPDPRIKALGITLGIGGKVLLKKKQRRIGKNG